MAAAKKCDICGRLYEPYNEQKNSNKPNGFLYINVGPCQVYKSGEPNDCCPVCMGSIEEFVSSLIGAGEVEPEKPDIPDTPTDPEEPPTEPENPGEESGENNG